MLARVLESLKNQTFKSFEVIVCDDASPTPLEPTAKSFAADLELAYHNNGVNKGRAATRNAGIERASGRIIFFLDCDQVSAPDCLAALAKHYEQREIQTVRCSISLPDELVSKSQYARYFNSRYLSQRPIDPSLDYDNLPPKFFASGSIATPKSVLDDIGGFSDDFRAYGGEDEELGVRLWKHGVPLASSRTATVWDCDDNLSIERACNRMIEYARESIPLLLRKHPEYLQFEAFRIFDASTRQLTLKERMMRSAVRTLATPRFSERLLRTLSARDNGQRTPPAILYQLCLAGFYLMGVRQRTRSQ